MGEQAYDKGILYVIFVSPFNWIFDATGNLLSQVGFVQVSGGEIAGAPGAVLLPRESAAPQACSPLPQPSMGPSSGGSRSRAPGKRRGGRRWRHTSWSGEVLTQGWTELWGWPRPDCSERAGRSTSSEQRREASRQTRGH